jgi:hypothetical protein
MQLPVSIPCNWSCYRLRLYLVESYVLTMIKIIDNKKISRKGAKFAKKQRYLAAFVIYLLAFGWNQITNSL